MPGVWNVAEEAEGAMDTTKAVMGAFQKNFLPIENLQGNQALTVF